MLISNALHSLGPFIEQLCHITNTPGVAIGVLHHGEVIHHASYGLQDIERRVPPNIDTSFSICSMTKAVTAAMIGQMVEEGKLTFDTQLQQIFPEFKRHDAAANITVVDLLSHRTGLPSYDALWTGSDNGILLDRAQAIPLMSYVPVAKPLRTEWLYNNVQYEILGQILEAISGKSYRDLLHERIIQPLQLNRTFYAEEPLDNNTAKSYVALSNGTSVEVPTWGHGKNLLIGAAGAIRSSISDLMVLYKSFIDAANNQMDVSGTATEFDPLKQMDVLLQGMIAMPGNSLREKSYSGGWVRAELPNLVDHFADYVPPVLGAGSPSRLMLNHQGYIAGNVGYVSLFPESSTAVVVLGNSAGLTDAMRLMGQALIETVFGNDLNQTLYIDTASQAAIATVQYVSDLHKTLLEGQTINDPVRPLETYAGRYYNSIGNFFIDILYEDDKLFVSYMGSSPDTFELQPYQPDQFFWFLDFDESARRARLPSNDVDYFIIKFGCHSQQPWWLPYKIGPRLECLIWKHEPEIPGEGELFTRSGSHQARLYKQPFQQDL